MNKSFSFRLFGLIALFAICIFSFMALPINIPYTAKAQLHTTAIADQGIYYIRNQRSGLYMDVQNASFDIPTQMVQYSYNGNNNQQFKLNRIGTDLYEIIPLCNYFNSNSYRLNVANASSANNAQIQTYSANGTAAQQFKIMQTGNNDGAFKILTATSNYTKCVTAANASMSTANLIQYTYSNDGTSDNDHWYFERSVINSVITIPFMLGYTNNIYFKIPDNKYYTVETFGSLNTTLTIENLSCGTITDYDSGEGSNAMLGFQGEQGTIINIKINPNTSALLTSCQLQIRRQQAVLYGFDYDLNTKPDINDAYDEISGMYNTFKFVNEENTHIVALDERGLPRLDSDVVLFAGHGSSIGVDFPHSVLTTSGFPEHINSKLIFWSTCNSALVDPIFNDCLVDASVEKGALCSIGFTVSVNSYSARLFSKRFFIKLADGYTVSNAAVAAKNALFWPFDNAKNYRIAGDGSTTITTPAPVPKSAAALNTSYVKELNYLLEREELYACNLSDNMVRYYRTIDGYITNECYDVVYDGKKNISQITHMGRSIDGAKILKIAQDCSAVTDKNSENRVNSDNLESTATHIIYYNFGKCVVPIEINYRNYYNRECRYYYQEVICINLATGDYIDYGDIVGG